MGGSVHEDKRSGKFTIKLYWEGKQRCISIDKKSNSSFSTKAHALKALGIIQCEIDAGIFDVEAWKKKQAAELKTVKWYSIRWLELRDERVKNNSLYKKTVRDDRTHLDNYILPKFGRRLIDSITSMEVSDFGAGINRSPAGVINVLGTFQKMLNDAVEEGIIGKAPKFPSLRKQSNQTKKSLGLDIQEQIISKIPKDDQGIFHFMVEYGVRPGEARGLLKKSIRDGFVVIESAFSDNELMHTTKTGVVREYPITQFFQEILDQLPMTNSELVFVRSKDGKRYSSKDINAIWHKACKAAGVSKFKLYNGVRHSKARNLLENGESFDMVAEVLGHASVDMTRRFYANMPMDRIKEALQKVRSKKKE